MHEHDTSKERPRTAEHWNARYIAGNTPWDTGRPDANLVATIEARGLSSGRVLDVGCGTGSEAVWMAMRGFTVTGVDLSATAIEAARTRAERAGAAATFVAGSVPDTAAVFDLVYDCGCFHCADGAADRRSFVESIARVLAPGGLWINIAGSTDGPPRDHGPPRVSAREIVAAVESEFEVLSMTTNSYDGNLPSPARAWVNVFERRD